MDIFLEYIVPRKKGAKEILITIGILLAAMILATVGTFLIAIPLLSGISLLVVAAAVYGAYYFITAQNIEYEYIVTNGELDVDKIIHRRKRKRIISVHSRTFDIVAPVGSPEHRGEENGSFTQVIDASSGIDDGSAYFAVFSKDGQRFKLIFEPTERMLEAFKTFIPRNVYTK